MEDKKGLFFRLWRLGESRLGIKGKAKGDVKKKTIVVLGGGFGGVYTAKYLERLFFLHRDEYEIVLVSRENYFTYQPMLAEVVGGSLGILDSVSSLRALLTHSTIYVREITDINIPNQEITLSPNFNHTDITLHFDYLVFALGTVTDFRTSPGGLHEHALPFKNLSDAFKLRNRLIDVVETAAIEKDPELRRQLLTFVVGGGGFSGVEIVAEVNDLIRKLAKKYKTLKQNDFRVVLVHSKDRLVDRELSPSLGRYAEKLLKERGVELIFNQHLVSATPYEAILDNDVRIATRTVISTVPSTSNPLLETLPFEMKSGHILTDNTLQVVGADNIWAIGDCAAIPSPTGIGYCPPTAQFAVREGKCVANNIYARCFGKKLKRFRFKELGMMAALGHRRAVAELFGHIKLSGFIAWIFWRVIYLMKLPGLSRKLRVGISWILEAFIPQEAVQLKPEVRSGINHLHYAKGEIIFHKGDVGDYLYIISKGRVEILEEKLGAQVQIAVLGKGEFFGEMALLRQKKRNATTRCLDDCELIAIRKQDFNILVTNFGDLRQNFLRTEQERHEKNKEMFMHHDHDKAAGE